MGEKKIKNYPGTIFFPILLVEDNDFYTGHIKTLEREYFKPNASDETEESM